MKKLLFYNHCFSLFLSSLLLNLLFFSSCGSAHTSPTLSKNSSLENGTSVESAPASPSKHHESSFIENSSSSSDRLSTPDPSPFSPSSSSLTPNQTPNDENLVPLSLYLPEVLVELRYAGENNFTGQKIYEEDEAYLRYGTVKKLKKVAGELEKLGLKLKIWDAYRPISAQFKLWEICPDSRYVADPTKGFSNHSRGGTVDVTLCNADGQELPMPSDFDDFSSRADRNYDDVSKEAADNSMLLEEILTRNGFEGYSAEWWHYNDTVTYPVFSVNDRLTF